MRQNLNPQTFRLRLRSKPKGKSADTIIRQSRRRRVMQFGPLSGAPCFTRQLHSIEEASVEFDHDESDITMLMSEIGFADIISMEHDAQLNKNGILSILNSSDNSIQRTIAHAIVHGGKDQESAEERLRSCIQHFAVSQNTSNEEESSFFFSSSFRNLDNPDDDDINPEDETDSDEEKQLRVDLHLLSLQLISMSLNQVLLTGNDKFPSSSSSFQVDDDEGSINFRDPFWITIIAAVIRNIELTKNDDITGYSLRLLRLLHSVEPLIVRPFLQQTLLPYLIYLKQYGESQKAPLIESEASRLLNRGEILETRYVSV